MARLRVAALVVMALSAACGEDLPVYSHVEDLRVIGVRADPPSFLVDAPPTAVTVEALVLDPRGGAVDWAWSVCPVESDTACSDFDEKMAEAAGPDAAAVAAERAALAAARAVAATGSASPEATGDLPAALAPYPVASFTIPAGSLSALGDYFAYNGFFGLAMGAWPSALLRVTKAGDEVSSQKRIPTLLTDPSAPPWGDVVSSEYHFSFCAAGQTEGCVPWSPSLAGNHNPAFSGVRYARGDSPLATWSDLPDGPLEVRAGEEIRLLPVFTADSFERYQAVRTSLQTGRIELVEQEESPSVSWFVTDGEVRDPLTWPAFTRTLDTVYTAPDAPPAATGGLVVVWLVGRDQRGGETWTHVVLSIVP